MTVGLLLAVLFTLTWAPLFWVRTESFGDAFAIYSPAERAFTVLAPLILTLHMTFGCLLMSLSDTLPPLRTAAGVTVFFAGVGFWLWARAAISPWRMRPRPDQPPLRFRSDGAFGLVRHPLYFGLLLSCAGVMVVSGEALLLLTLALCILVLDVRARQEEVRLRAQLGGEYDAYRRAVKRLIPFVW